MPDVEGCQEIQQAVATDTGNENERLEVIKKAIATGCVEFIPDSWSVEVGEENG